MRVVVEALVRVARGRAVTLLRAAAYEAYAGRWEAALALGAWGGMVIAVAFLRARALRHRPRRALGPGDEGGG